MLYKFVTLGIQYAMRMHHIVMCDLPRSYNIFALYFTNGMIFEKKVIEYKNVCFDVLYIFCLKHISF